MPFFIEYNTVEIPEQPGIQLGEALQAAIVAFEQETGLCVDNIFIDRVQVEGEPTETWLDLELA